MPHPDAIFIEEWNKAALQWQANRPGTDIITGYGEGLDGGMSRETADRLIGLLFDAVAQERALGHRVYIRVLVQRDSDTGNMWP